MHANTRHQPIMAALVALGSVLIATVPLLWVTYPPFTDLPNHLARIMVLRAEPGSPLLDYYQVHWAILPNLATDFLLLAASYVMPLAMAAKLLVVLIAIGWVTAPMLLHFAVYRRISVVPTLAMAFFFNRALIMGFINFTFGSVAVVFAVAVWALLERQRFALRALVAVVLATALFFCHLFVAAIFLIAVVVWELLPSRDRETTFPRRLLLIACVVLPVTCGYLLTPSDGASAFAHGWSFDMLGLLIGSAYDAALFVQSGSFWGVLAFCWLLIGIVVAVFLKPDLRLGVICAILFALFVVLPFDMLGGSHVDWRMLAPFCLFATAWLPFHLGRYAGPAWGIVALAFVTIQTHSINIIWQRGEAQYRQFENLVADLPQHSRLYFSALAGDARPGDRNYIGLPNSVLHYGAYGVLERGLIVPSLFSRISQQPIVVLPQFAERHRNLAQAKAWSFDAIDWDLVASDFDFAILATSGAPPTPGGLTALGQNGIFHLYRVNR